MKATARLHDLGQSLWLDNITRDLLDSGTLARYIAELSVTGLTSNPTIFDHAIKGSSDYDAAIRSKLKSGKSGESLFFELALADITRAADLFRPVHDRTRGVDGWVSLEVSPLLAYDTQTTLAAARDLSARAARPNLFIKIPGTKEGLPAIEEAIFAGVPVNVTLLFSREHYLAAADAYLRGIERRIAAGLPPDVGSVASLFVSRWDVAVAAKVPPRAREQARHRDRPAHVQGVLRPGGVAALSPRDERRRPAAAAAVREHRDQGPQGVRRPVRRGARGAVHRQHDPRRHAARGGRPRRRSAARRPPTAATARPCSREFKSAGVDVDALAAQLQDEGAKSFVNSWNELMGVLAAKSATLGKAA